MFKDVLAQSIPQEVTGSPTALQQPQDVASAWRHLAEPRRSAVSATAHSEPLRSPGGKEKPPGSLGQPLSPMLPPPYVPHQQ